MPPTTSEIEVTPTAASRIVPKILSRSSTHKYVGAGLKFQTPQPAHTGNCLNILGSFQSGGC